MKTIEQLEQEAKEALEICLLFSNSNKSECEDVFLRFKQAIYKDSLDVESFRSILEFAPYISRVLSGYFNISTSELKSKINKSGISGLELITALSNDVENLRKIKNEIH